MLLAKKYHPDALRGEQETDESGKEKKGKLSEADLEERERVFKQITEAYSVLADSDLRKKYDRLIFGSSAYEETSSDFENQD